MVQSADRQDRAGFYWKRAVAVRDLAGTLTTPEARAALLQIAADYECAAEALTRELLLGDDLGPDNRSLTAH